MEKKCIAPWVSLTIDTKGFVSPCCKYKSIQSIFNNTLEEVWESFDSIRANMVNGLEDPGCSDCYKMERAGFISKRQKLNSSKKHILEKINNGYAPKLKYLEISFGNTCNLYCVMCNDTYSSKWSSILGNKNNIHFQNLINLSTDFFEDVDKIEILGGEPLLYNLVEKLKRFKNIKEILITTNLAYDIDKLKEITDEYKNIYLNLSIDGVEKTYEYIRGYPWDKINYNLSELENLDLVGISIHPSISLLNFYDLKNLYERYDKIKIKNKKFLWDQFVYSPNYLQYKLLGDKILGYYSSDYINDQSYQKFYCLIENTNFNTNKELIKECSLYLEKINKYRKISYNTCYGLKDLKIG